jgi:gamma-glutamyltranspeptidase / glutathione hydrolase
MRDFVFPGRSMVAARSAAVATSHALASASAISVLARGGNAFDAAIAACAVLCVVESHMTGIGGDCFVLFRPAATGRIQALNGSGRTPGAASIEELSGLGGAEIPRRSPQAITIPGAVDAWWRLHGDHGRLPWRELFAAAIDYAENGYPIAPRVAWDWARERELIMSDPGLRGIVAPDGRIPVAGDIHRQPALAATLRTIADGGRAGFYEGKVAKSLVGYLRAMGGRHSLEDFTSQHAEIVEPVSTDYRGYRIFECPPNGQGIAALVALNILRGLSLERLPEAEWLHLVCEAIKQGYAVRDGSIADPAHARVPVEAMLSEDFAARLRRNVTAGIARSVAPIEDVEHKDTTYLCAIDREGNAISFINSLFSPFGTGLAEPETGIFLHNRGTSFRSFPGHVNTYAARKRPMHTIIPGMISRDGRLVSAFGVMGGHYQAAGHVTLLSRIIDRGLDIQEAIDAPRVFPFGGKLQIESSVPAALREALASAGHVLEPLDRPLGGAQCIWLSETGAILAGSDGRKDGCALGF